MPVAIADPVDGLLLVCLADLSSDIVYDLFQTVCSLGFEQFFGILFGNDRILGKFTSNAMTYDRLRTEISQLGERERDRDLQIRRRRISVTYSHG